jgi:hypothetical protein
MSAIAPTVSSMGTKGSSRAGGWIGMDGRPAAVKNYLAYTLRRLGTEYVDIYRPAAGSRSAPNLTLITTASRLRPPQRFAQEQFVVARPIEIASVQQGEARVQRRADCFHARRLIRPTIQVGHSHAAQTEGGYTGPADPELTRFHDH